MKKICALFLILTFTVFLAWAQDSQPDESARLAELDAYWAEVSRCVKEGDFEGYTATFHKDGVFVAGTTNVAYPITQALERWEIDFTQTKSGEISANVELRFSKRLGDETTAHETGMFYYSKVDSDGTKTGYYIELQALLVKRGTWKALMEYQVAESTEEEWNKLK